MGVPPAVASGTSWTTSQCSTIRPSRTRTTSVIALPRDPGVRRSRFRRQCPSFVELSTPSPPSAKQKGKDLWTPPRCPPDMDDVEVRELRYFRAVAEEL